MWLIVNDSEIFKTIVQILENITMFAQSISGNLFKNQFWECSEPVVLWQELFKSNSAISKYELDWTGF